MLNSDFKPLLILDCFDLKSKQSNGFTSFPNENEFPVEVFINYNGNKFIESKLVIENKGNKIKEKKITLSASKSSSSHTFYLKTN